MSGSLVRLFHATPEKDNIVIINNDEITNKRIELVRTLNSCCEKINNTSLKRILK